MSLLLLLACVGRPPPAASPSTEPQVLLAGQVSLSVDYSAGRANLTVHSLRPELRPLPQERNGVPMDTCRLVEPTRATADMVLMPREVQVSCDGEPLTLEEQVPGLHRHVFELRPEPGLRCAVKLGDAELELPLLPAPPDPRLEHGRLRWSAGGADELRYVVPQSGGQSWICRLVDDGDAPVPPGARLSQAFFTRHALAAYPLGKGEAQIAVTVTSGIWVTPEAL